MIKIKEGVDLKELEKFGFKYDEEMEYYYKKCIGTFNRYIIFAKGDIDCDKGTIVFHNSSDFETTIHLDDLYDLIQANLVEKVKEY